MIAYKCTRADGTDFRTGRVRYEVGATLEVATASTDGAPCGVGLHVSPTAKMTCRYGDRSIDRGRWRWFEVEIDESDICGRDDSKLRVRKLRVLRELTVVDVFGARLADQVAAQRAQVATWKDIPWLRPSGPVGQGQLVPLCAKFHDATKFWLAKRGINRDIPRVARIITDRTVAIDVADQARREYYADADADAAAAAAAVRPSWLWWYLRPYWVLFRHSRFILGGMTEPNPFAPIVEMYKLGVLPLGWVNGEFCIYVPKAVGAVVAA